jgi:hypothetical protein
MMYASFACVSGDADISGDFSDSVQWCAHACLTADAADATYEIAIPDGSAQPITTLARCYTAAVTDVTNGGGIALPCATLEGYQYGWFWVEGVCPCKDVTLMKGDADSLGGAEMTTDGGLVAGAAYLCLTGSSQLLTSTDWSSLIDGTTPNSPELPVAFSTEAD